MTRMSGLSRAVLLAALAGSFASVPPAQFVRAASIPSTPRTRGNPLPKRGTRSTTVAAMKRAARKRRNVRARSCKRS